VRDLSPHDYRRVVHNSICTYSSICNYLAEKKRKEKSKNIGDSFFHIVGDFSNAQHQDNRDQSKDITTKNPTYSNYPIGNYGSRQRRIGYSTTTAQNFQHFQKGYAVQAGGWFSFFTGSHNLTRSAGHETANPSPPSLPT